ncbi:hypothetical protein LXL04_028635 [Taraxacum kok-saghyz]
MATADGCTAEKWRDKRPSLSAFTGGSCCGVCSPSGLLATALSNTANIFQGRYGLFSGSDMAPPLARMVIFSGLPYSRCFSSSAKHGCFFSIKTDTFCFSITIQFYPLQIQEIKEVSPFVKVPSKRNKYRKIMIHGAEWLQKIIIHMVMLKSDQTLLHSKATPTLVAKKPKFRRLKLKYNFKQTPKSYNRNQIYNLNQKI